ncbi:MAG: master DNA invertase Mpi family serine-type recombinase [Alphaproteobacteria bacterium]|jgi:DNA invertase Pin-like site-specific DNA recombinase|nr:master DNA invertase Mpi family serine-type recombinase [Alphaproteobacteria bacterium]
MIYGYIRVSTDQQSTSNQKFEINRYAASHNIQIDRWVEETISSRKPLNKRKLGSLLAELKDGDILISTEISRLGRSLLEVMGILQHCLAQNCQIWTLKEHYKLGSDIASKVLAFAFGLSAEIERQLISERTKMSLDKLKSQGKHLGRPFGAKSKSLKLSKNTKRVKDLMAKGLPKAQIARLLGVDKLTLYRFLKKLESEE